MAFGYEPALESPAVADLRPSYGLFVDGGFRDPAAGMACVTPATGAVLTEVADAGAGEVDAAVAAARRAHTDVWGPMPGRERAKYLFRLARLVQERSRELAALEAMDAGIPVREAAGVELPLVAAHLFHHAGWADKLRYALPAGADPAPVGVVAAVLAGHWPLLLLAWKVAPALACGNTVVLKPSGTTPLAALRFAELCQQADLPPGVVNVVTGGPETGRWLVEHPGVDLVAFAGSTAVGRAVARSAAASGTRLSLHLGGRSATVVLDDAPLDEAVDGVIDSAFRSQGPICAAGSRLLVQEPVAEQLLTALKRRMGRLRVGDPLDRNTDVGPVASGATLDQVRGLCAAGDAEGTTRWTPPCQLPEQGFWFPPTLFTGASQAHRISQEEVSGPVLAVQTFRTPAEAVQKANNTPYGLSASVWGEKGSRVLAVAQRLRVGVVWANSGPRFDPAAPFGGFKESGHGRDGGRHGLEAYLAS